MALFYSFLSRSLCRIHHQNIYLKKHISSSIWFLQVVVITRFSRSWHANFMCEWFDTIAYNCVLFCRNWNVLFSDGECVTLVVFMCHELLRRAMAWAREVPNGVENRKSDPHRLNSLKDYDNKQSDDVPLHILPPNGIKAKRADVIVLSVLPILGREWFKTRFHCWKRTKS